MDKEIEKIFKAIFKVISSTWKNTMAFRIKVKAIFKAFLSTW